MPGSRKFLGQRWCDLRWSPWVAFSQEDFDALVAEAGVYRVRPISGNSLAYIGQTGRSLRGRLGSLRKYSLKKQMPYNDPHTAAPNLWAWRIQQGMRFACSAAPISASDSNRKALEAYLLWRYRIESRKSTLCNHGWFHPQYSKPGNKATKRRMRKLVGKRRREGAPHAPLEERHLRLDSSWWKQGGGLTGDDVRKEFHEDGAGLYVLLDKRKKDQLYFGQSKQLRDRLLSHSRKRWGPRRVSFAVHKVSPAVISRFPHVLDELENDLIGIYYKLHHRAPNFQFRNKH